MMYSQSRTFLYFGFFRHTWKLYSTKNMTCGHEVICRLIQFRAITFLCMKHNSKIHASNGQHCRYLDNSKQNKSTSHINLYIVDFCGETIIPPLSCIIRNQISLNSTLSVTFVETNNTYQVFLFKHKNTLMQEIITLQWIFHKI